MTLNRTNSRESRNLPGRSGTNLKLCIPNDLWCDLRYFPSIFKMAMYTIFEFLSFESAIVSYQAMEPNLCPLFSLEKVGGLISRAPPVETHFPISHKWLGKIGVYGSLNLPGKVAARNGGCFRMHDRWTYGIQGNKNISVIDIHVK